MCGIAGIFRRRGVAVRDDDRELLRQMARTLRHRGPDDLGVEVHGPIGLSFARLSIIDIEGGHQPMLSVSGNSAIVFNGEIYNHAELRRDLERQGHRFTTRSDTEVLLAMYEQHGEGMLEHLNGMFAFAIHDRRTNELFLARDRVGIKPLYYFESPDMFVFGSEIKALLCEPSIEPEIDPHGLNDYLSYRFVPAPRTIYRNVRALLPAHCLRVGAKSDAAPRRYWEVRRTRVVSDREEALATVRELLFSSVKMQMISDVPIGAMLSSGLDSGLVVAMMSRAASGPIKTFSVGFEEAEYNELEGAARVAQMYGTNHTEIICRPEVESLIQRLAVGFDQPFGDSSAVPTYLVSQCAKQQVTVALSGDGGDEAFAGYRLHGHYVRRARHNAIRSVLRYPAAAVARLLDPQARGAQRLRRFALTDLEFHVDLAVLADPRLKARMLGPRLLEEVDAYESLKHGFAAGGPFEDEGGLRRLQHQFLTLTLPDDMLTKVDITSMMHSLEVRVPLLDHRLVEFGMNLSAELKNDGLHGKLLLRQLAAELLPPGHLDYPKRGFGIPGDRWLRNELRPVLLDSLGASKLAQDGWLEQSFIATLVKRQLTGRPDFDALWAVLMLELWYRSHSADRIQFAQANSA